jgi:hypothetical protein
MQLRADTMGPENFDLGALQVPYGSSRRGKKGFNKGASVTLEDADLLVPKSSMLR